MGHDGCGPDKVPQLRNCRFSLTTTATHRTCSVRVRILRSVCGRRARLMSCGATGQSWPGPAPAKGPQRGGPQCTHHNPANRQMKKQGPGKKAQTVAGIHSKPPSSRGESHPPALTDPYVTVSRYTALVVLITRLAVLTESRPSGRRTGAARPQPAPTPYGLSSVSAVACTSSASTASGNC